MKVRPLISWDLHFTARLPIFGSQGKTDSFFNFDRPIVTKLKLKGCCDFVLLIPSPPRRRKNKQNMHFTQKGTIAKGKCHFPTMFSFRYARFRGSIKACSIVVYLKIHEQRWPCIYEIPPPFQAKPRKNIIQYDLKKHPFGEQPKLKATQPWNQAPKKKSNGWKMIPFGSNLWA